MRIGDLARATGASARSLRLYERVGLIEARRAANGYRHFAPSTVARVRNIRALLAAGLTLDDVHAFRACLDGDVAAAPPSPEGIAVARARLRVIDERIAAQRQVRDRLAHRLEGLPDP